MTSEELRGLRLLVDRYQRDRLQIPLCPGGWGSQAGYRNHGCRCRACKKAVSDAKRTQRARQARGLTVTL